MYVNYSTDLRLLLRHPVEELLWFQDDLESTEKPTDFTNSDLGSYIELRKYVIQWVKMNAW